MTSNPQMKSVFEKNPELKAALQDDSTLKMISQSMTNPSMRKEMTRNLDRAMANIETMPGGWDALQRLYHTFQEPLMDAAIPKDSNPSSNPSNSHTEDKGVNNSALPNPWQRTPPRSLNPFGGGYPNLFGNAGNSSATYQNLFGSSPLGSQTQPQPNLFSPFIAPNSFSPSNSSLDQTPLKPTPVPPVEENYEVLFKSKMEELVEMGFTDRSANLAALIEADGDLDKAITILFPDPNEK